MAKWTGGLALLLALPTLAFLLQPPPKLSPAPTRQPQNVAAEGDATVPKAEAASGEAKSEAKASAKSRNRAPPTKASASSLALGADATTAEIRVGCEGPQSTRVPASVREARLTGGYCLMSASAAEPQSKIRNESNGFSATTFYPRAREFMTDYISLSPGPNKIAITHAWPDGLTETREYVLDRASP